MKNRLRKRNRRKAVTKRKTNAKGYVRDKKKYGKNAILKGTNLTEGATAIERNEMIGGHKA